MLDNGSIQNPCNMMSPDFGSGNVFSNQIFTLSNLYQSVLYYEKYMQMVSLQNQLLMQEFFRSSLQMHQTKEECHNQVNNTTPPKLEEPNQNILPEKKEKVAKTAKVKFLIIKTHRQDPVKRRVIKNNKIVFSHSLSLNQKKKLIMGQVNIYYLYIYF